MSDPRQRRAPRDPRAPRGADATGDVFETRLDAALRAWPERPADAQAQDDFAARVRSRIAAGARGATRAYLSDEKILAAPLPESDEERDNSAAFGETRDARSAPGTPATRAIGAADVAPVRATPPRDAPAGAEGTTMSSHSPERERDRRSFQDLARLASSPSLNPPPPASVSGVRPTVGAPSGTSARDNKEDSGLIDLKALASDPAIADRATPVGAGAPTGEAGATPLASAGLFDDDTGAPPAVTEPATAAPSLVPPALMAAPSVRPARDARRHGAAKKSGVVAMFGGVAAVAALAAGLFLVLRPAKTEPVIVVHAPASDTRALGAATPAPAAPAAPTESEARATTPTGATTAAAESAATGGDPRAPTDATKSADAPTKAARAVATNGASTTKSAATPAKSGKSGTSDKAEKPSDKIAAADKATDPKLVAKDLPTAPPIPNALNDAMKQAAGPGGSDPSPASVATSAAAFEPGSVPQKPSVGAVTGALGAALPSARACLGPDDPISRAEVVFGSSGAVQSVTVTGSAAGKPAEACIKAALGRAKVPPFAQPSFSARVTVRPN